MSEDGSPPRGRFGNRPASRAGRSAGWLSLVAVLALVLSNILVNAFERDATGIGHDLLHLAKPVLIATFAVGSLAGLVLAARSLRAGDRSVVVWAAFGIGLLAALLLIAEFTVLE